jgi:hypothetical protein
MDSAEGSTVLAAGIENAGDIPKAATVARAYHRGRALPSFIVAGPPRTGTSWLHEVLRDHTNLPSPTKETRFFDLRFDRGLDWYLDHFPRLRDGLPLGEVAPTYFASSTAQEHLRSTLPHAKLVFIFRHPVHRLISLYRLKRAYGMHDWDLDTAMHRDPELIGSSRYATHLRKWQQNFPERQLFISLYEDLSSDPQSFVDRLVDFLEIPRFRLHGSQLGQVYSSIDMTEPRNYLATRTATAMANWCKARKLDHVVAGFRNSHLIRLVLGGGTPFPEVPIETRRKISEMFLPETEELESIIGRDLSSWKMPPLQPNQ